MGVLTDADRKLLPVALRQHGGFRLATQWYCMDFDPLWYQYLFHQSQIPNVTFIAGIASGKTTSVAASNLIDCLTLPYFRALNTSVTAKQAELPFEMVMSWIEGNKRLEHLVQDISLRPYPTISFRNFSEWIFRTAGKDARFIRGLEFDRINYDEAGLDYNGETIKVLRGRLRGVRPDKTHRMGRLDVMTSPTDAPWLEDRFNKGWKEYGEAELGSYFSLRISTYMNTRLTSEQIRLMEAEYSDEMIDVELGGKFPDYGVSMFPKLHIQACTDQSLNDALEMALRPEEGLPKKGWRVEEHPRYGITQYEAPYDPRGIYIMAGDPGTDSPPKRNSGVVLVFDIAHAPGKLAYFHWIDGKGSYSPFLSSYKYAIEKYRPVLKGLDTTGTQKAIDELAFENAGISVDGINFSRDKDALLNSLSMAVTSHGLCWPVIKGLVRQLSSYSRENDKKLAQDIVMTLAIIAFLERQVPGGRTGEMPSQNNYRPPHWANIPHGGRRRR